MKRLLQLGFVVGLVGTFAAAYFYPWVDYTRYRSETSVVANGGRVEQFVVHLPADRIDPREVAGDAAPTFDQFKLRDVNGNVIGLAAKHRVETTAGAATSWLLTIPSRGSIVLTAAAGATEPGLESIEAMLLERGWEPGQSVEQQLSIDLGNPAQSVTTTGEFRGIDFELIETWEVSGLDDDGNVRGTLRLNTVGRQAS
ncbi:MAG: hypothetical protein R3305_00275 [Gammaproteobacteria bacterium]|nr:hypothetical protein [Gammaproteobacteria bacterium]